MLVLTILILSFIYCIHKYFTKNFDYFKKQNIPGPTPVPILGNWSGVWSQQYHLLLLENQKKYGKIYGTFDGRIPNLVVADTEILRKILVQDFDSFKNRREFFFNNRYLPLNVGALRDDKWKNVRSSMSIAFTSGKIRKGFDSMVECAEGMVEHLHHLTSTSEEINAKEITVGYAMDVISSCVLGMKLQTLRNPDDPFVQKGLKVLQGNPKPLNNFIFILCTIYPHLTLLPTSAFSEVDFFIEVAKRILNGKKLQSASGVERHDFLQLLLDLAKEESSPFRDDDLVLAQVLVFMLAGFDTPATGMVSTLHCLAMNQSAQDRLRGDIRSGIKTHGGITYDCLQDLPYLEQCISEALRLHPASTKTERECGKTVVYDNIKIEKGMVVTVPIYAIHHDPEIYPDPEKFDPERFTPEEKAKRDPLNYLAFGYGPRGCLGTRFAYEELKLGIAHIINNFRLVPSKRTKDPPIYLDGIFALSALVAPELWMTFEKFE